MLNNYIIKLGAIAVTAGGVTPVVAQAQKSETKILFQGKIFSSEDETLDYMFSSEFLKVEKESVIGEMQNSYSNYDLGTLNKGLLPTYNPENTKFAWRMANGMLTDSIDDAKETYFNEGISNTLYSDGYGNDYLTQEDAIISAKRKITNMFNPYVELPLLDSNGAPIGKKAKYNPFNKTDVDMLKRININKLIERKLIEGEVDRDNDFQIYDVKDNNDSSLIINNEIETEFHWYDIHSSEQTFTASWKTVGEWQPNETIAINYIADSSKKVVIKEYVPDYGNWYLPKYQDNIWKGKKSDHREDNIFSAVYKGQSFSYHNPIRIEAEDSLSTNEAYNLIKNIVMTPNDYFKIHLNSNEERAKVFDIKRGTSIGMPKFDSFQDQKKSIKQIKNTLKENISTSDKNTVDELFKLFESKMKVTVKNTKPILQLVDMSGKNSVDFGYSHSGRISNRLWINKFDNPTVSHIPEEFHLDISALPYAAKIFLNNLPNNANDKYVEGEMALYYDNQKIFNIETDQNGYKLTNVENSGFKSRLKKLNDSNQDDSPALYQYVDDNSMDSATVLNNYYRQSETISASWEMDYKLDLDDILYLDSYSYANQLLTSKQRFNPSFSSSTTPTSFITSETEFKTQESLFVPRPAAKYVFYDLNGRKIHYSEDAYDSFELMKRNIMRNIYVPKSSEYVYVKDNGITKQINNHVASIYRLNIDDTDVYFAEHTKMRSYVKKLLNNFVKYL